MFFIHLSAKFESKSFSILKCFFPYLTSKKQLYGLNNQFNFKISNEKYILSLFLALNRELLNVNILDFTCLCQLNIINMILN